MDRPDRIGFAAAETKEQKQKERKETRQKKSWKTSEEKITDGAELLLYNAYGA